MYPLSFSLFVLGLIGPLTFFVIYPAFLVIVAFWKHQSGSRDVTTRPTMDVVVVVRNARTRIARKIEEVLEQDYPLEKLRIILVSDGSTDGTIEVAREYGGDRVIVIEQVEHKGKIQGLNLAMTHCRADVVVFSDVDASLHPHTMHLLAEKMADPSVGGVCGRQVIALDGKDWKKAQQNYLDWDTRVKLLESRVKSTTSNTGKLFAVRRELLVSIPEAVTDDLFLAMAVVDAGARFVMEPRAVAIIPVPSRSREVELIRRRRITSQSLRGMWTMRRLFNPLKYGIYAPGLFVNKILRRLMPVFLIMFFFGSLGLSPFSPFAALLAALQAGGYLLALAASMQVPLGVLKGPGHLALYFCAGSLGMLLGIRDFLSGKRWDKWNPDKDPAGLVDQDKDESIEPKVAYMMSRFPKLTETFVLYEILALKKKGIQVEIFPLIHHRESTMHPESRAMLPRVHFAGFADLGVLRSNAVMLVSHPGIWFGALRSVVLGNRTSRDFLLKSLAIFPQSVHFARQMKGMGICHVHAHFATHPTMAAYIVQQVAGIPFSFTAHAHDIQMDQTMLAEKIRAAAFVVAISEYNRQMLVELGGQGSADRIHVIHCGTDLRRTRPVADKPAAGSCFEIICVASFKDMKGHEVLVRALALLRDRGTDFRCRLVGDGPLRGQIREMVARYGLEDRIVFCGLQTSQQVREMVAGSHVMVLASVPGRRGDMDGIPVVFMEAMAAGLPVVGSRLSGIPELVEDRVTGYLTEPGDQAGLAEALGQLADNGELRARMGRAGRRKVEAEFDLHANADALAGLFLERMANHPCSGRETP